MAKTKQKKSVFNRTKPHLNIGTIGHVDHGKTTLTAAITKALSKFGNTEFYDYADIDSHVEEQQRGITINAAHIEYETNFRHYSHIDCPGHQDYIKNMITGASQMDGVILVVSAIDGIQVQTREHIILAKEIGIPYLVIFLNKADKVLDDDFRMLVELEVRELLEKYKFPEDLPCVHGSALMALNEDLDKPSTLGLNSIYKLMDSVDNYIKQPERLVNENFLMPIESIFSAAGRGTVVTGRVEKGIINVNDELEIIGKKYFKTICLGLEMFRKSLIKGEVGDNLGVLLKNIDRKQIARGNVLGAKGTLKAFTAFTAKVYILTAKEGGRKKSFISNYKPQFFFRTLNVTGTISILNKDLAMPGDSLDIEVTLVEPCVIEKGLNFIIREGKLTIGAGFITDTLNQKKF